MQAFPDLFNYQLAQAQRGMRKGLPLYRVRLRCNGVGLRLNGDIAASDMLHRLWP